MANENVECLTDYVEESGADNVEEFVKAITSISDEFLELFGAQLSKIIDILPLESLTWKIIAQSSLVMAEIMRREATDE